MLVILLDDFDATSKLMEAQTEDKVREKQTLNGFKIPNIIYKLKFNRLTLFIRYKLTHMQSSFDLLISTVMFLK